MNLKTVLLAGVTLLGFGAAEANAALITSFAQEATTNTVTATNNGAGATSLSIADALVTLGGGILGVIPGATFALTATSIDAAVSVGASIIQHFSGNFCLSSGPGCTGNYLSGVFTDAAFGAGGGPGLTVNVNNPPEQLTLSSNVLPASELNPPSSFNLTFVNLSNPLAIDAGSINSFTASFTGDVSASTVEAMEPGTLALLGVGMLGLAFVRRKGSPPLDA